MNMKTSIMGQVEILADEAIVLTRYKDSAGIWTIGAGVTDAAGHVIQPSKFRGEITIKEAFEMFQTVLKNYEDAVNRAVKVPLKQHEFDALVSFHYNTGQVKAGSVDDKINKGDKKAAMATLLRYNKRRNPHTNKLEVSNGLTKRRAKEQHLFETGLYGDGNVTLYKATKSGKVVWSSAKRINALRELGVPDSIKALPDERIEQLERIAHDAAATDRISTTKIAASVTGVGSAIGAGSQVVEQIHEAQTTLEMLVSASPWLLLVLVCVGSAFYIWRERNRKAKEALI